jgi:streptomycin 6-kinase
MTSRVEALARQWRVTVEESFETGTAVIAFGNRDARPVVMKVLKAPSDEWLSGDVLTAFDGRGVASVYEHTAGAVLLERLTPGGSLVSMVVNGRDEEATDILAGVIANTSARTPPGTCATAEDLASAFERFVATGGDGLPRDLVEEGHRLDVRLCASQRQPRLLHGDLHHDNVLFDRERGWLAIDPKGVVGELEYEIGAALRNPIEHPHLFAASAIVERRVAQCASRLTLAANRVLAWGFAQAVLSAIWATEDGAAQAAGSFVQLADVIRPMLVKTV